jgi:hypothetical protein
MNVEIRAEAAQFPEKEYVTGIAIAVQFSLLKMTNTATLNEWCTRKVSVISKLVYS